MWTLADFCILVETKWIPSDTCKNYHRSWHLELILEFKSSAHWDLRIFIKQKENVRFPSPTSLLGNPCLIYPSPDATMACPQTSALSLMGSPLSVPVFGLQLEYCLQQFPRENFFSFLSGHSFPTWFTAVLCKALIDYEHRYMLDWNPSLILSLVLSVPLCKMKTINSVDRIMLEQSEWGAWGKITCVPVFLSGRSVQRRCRRSLCGGEIEGLKGVMRGMWGSSQS